MEFRDFFIADELNSMAFSMWMGVYFFCVYSWHWNDLGNEIRTLVISTLKKTNTTFYIYVYIDIHCNVPKMWVTPFLASLPPLWRGLQCLRRYHDSKEKHHLVNGLKYVTSIMATMLAGVRRISRKFIVITKKGGSWQLNESCFFFSISFRGSILDSCINHQLIVHFHLGYQNGLGLIGRE